MALENAPVRHEQTRPGDGGAKAAAILGAEGNDRATVGDARANTAAATVREVQSGTLPALQIDDANPADAHRPEQKPAAHDLGFWQTAGSVIGDMVHGAVDEVVHHPGQILEAAAVGVAAGAVGAVALATVPEVAAVVGGAMLIYQGAELVSHVPEWYHDAKVIAHAGENSAEDVAKAHQAFQTVGADTAVIGAGLAGSVVGARLGMMGLRAYNDSVNASIVADHQAAPTAADRNAAIARSTDRPQYEVPGDRYDVGTDMGKVQDNGYRLMNADETKDLYNTARAVNGDLQFAKPALDPTSPKYFQVEAHQVDLGKFPDGLRVGSTESPLSADSDITLADGRVIPQGKLPTGVQVAGDTIHTPPDGVTLSNGTVLHDGMTIPDGAALSGGQQVGSGDWVLTRNTTLADGTPGYDMYTPHNDQMLARWKPVAGQPGQFSPNSVPTDMGFIPSGKVEIPTSWGTAKGEGPMFIAKYGEGDYNIITWKDATEHGYLDLPTNQAAEDFIGQPARVALMGSPEDLISWLHNI